MTATRGLGVHSHCAYCTQESVWSVGPAVTWQSPRRITQDVCLAHVIQAIHNLHDDGCAMVQVSRVRSHFHGVTGHNAEHSA